jgi:hypothetical protein
VEYEPVIVDGVRVGWLAKDRDAWRAPLARAHPAPVDVDTMSIEKILDSLDAWNPGLPLRARLAVAYERDAVRVSRLTTAILNEPGLRDPCAVLHYRLGALELGET